MSISKTVAVALSFSALLILGAMTFGLSRNAYAHTFGGNESAAFLAKVQELKVETHLIQQNLSNKTLVAWHSDKIGEFWNANDTKEMNERNKRLAADIPALITNITDAANSTSPDATKVGDLVTSLDGVLGEAVSVRIEKPELGNATVNALAIVAVLDETMEDYGIALGAEEGQDGGASNSTASELVNMSSMTSMSSSDNMSPNNSTTNETKATIVNFAAYQTAQGLAAAAQQMYTDLKPKAMPDSASQIAALDAAFAKLKESIDGKMPDATIMVIVHGSIHPNLSAFGVKEEKGAEAVGEGHSQGHGNANIPKSVMMYAEKAGDQIHSEHLAEKAAISAGYNSDTKYTLTTTGKATSLSGAPMTEDAKMTLNLATWKSGGRVLYMDILGGTITVGNESAKVNSGQAYYIMNGRLMFAFATVMPENGNSMQLVSIKAMLPNDDNKLPTSTSDKPLSIDILGSSSRIRPNWSLQASGQIVQQTSTDSIKPVADMPTQTSQTDKAFPTVDVAYVFSPNKITVVDPTTMKTKVLTNVQNVTWGDAIATEDHKLVFANDETNSQVVVIDAQAQKIIKEIAVGPKPVHIYNPFGGNEIWTHSDEEGAFYVIDTKALEVTTTVEAALNGTGHGKLVYSDQLGDKAYATNVNDAAVHEISLKDKKETKVINTCQGTHGLSYSEISHMLYFACGGPQQVSVVDPRTDTLVRNIDGGSQVWPGAHELMLSQHQKYILSPMKDQRISVIDVNSSKVVGYINLNATVGNMVVMDGSDGKEYAFAPDADHPFVYVFDAQAMKLAKKIPLGEEVSGVKAPDHGTGIAESNDYVFVTRQTDGNLGIINAHTLDPSGTVLIEKGVSGVTYVGEEPDV